jgi:hypothetical protein
VWRHRPTATRPMLKSRWALILVATVCATCATLPKERESQQIPPDVPPQSARQSTALGIDIGSTPAMEAGTLADWAIVAITLFGTIAALLTLRVLLVQTRIARDGATAAKDTALAVLLAERAYISMSHLPPGLVPSPPAGGMVVVRCSVAVQNKGNTPARVIDAQLFTHSSVAPLPEAPPYGQASVPRSAAYLVKDEQFHMNGEFFVPFARWAEVQAGTVPLWVLGYVDYIDFFNRRHRAGYARRYNPNAPAGSNNNLPFETKEAYNYDIPLGTA